MSQSSITAKGGKTDAGDRVRPQPWRELDSDDTTGRLGGMAPIAAVPGGATLAQVITALNTVITRVNSLSS
jgi:hypothetical protein